MNLVPLISEPEPKPAPLTKALIELLFAGHALAECSSNLAQALGTPQALQQASESSTRYNAAVEAVRKWADDVHRR